MGNPFYIMLPRSSNFPNLPVVTDLALDIVDVVKPWAPDPNQ
jgi:hypothetical protein